ncbi:MAG TPA: NAD-dependent protein deacylase [Deltaproteobacteria bacterium]|nr:NAD-dependent protein deacylase [Deltaproteobacteria bacterium]
MTNNIEDKISIVAREIAKDGNNVVFTGAGISTESGIPDFRSKGGIWDKYRPIYFDEFMSSKKARIEYWQRHAELYPDLMKAKPNPAHMAVAELHDMGLLEAVITQNIDGLHQDSGIPHEKVIELHGNTRRARCMSCRKIVSLHEVHKRIEHGDPAPECECGGYLKSDTISFGQAMPEDEVKKATDLSRNADFFMVVGSTLLVHPAAAIPGYATQNGSYLVIVNLSETPYDDVSDVLIQGKAGEVLPVIVKDVRQLRRM